MLLNVILYFFMIFKDCTISINASKSAGYTDKSWIAMIVSVRDYTRDDIQYGSSTYLSGKFSLSTTSLQVLFFLLLVFL